MKNNFINLSIYLLYLLPLALVTGPFLPDLFISIIGIIFLIISIKEKKWNYFKNKFVYLFFAFYIFLLISSFNSEHIYHSLESSLFYFRFGVFALAVWFLLDTNRNVIKIFSNLFLIFFIISIFDGYYQYLYDSSIFGYSSPGNRLNLMLNDDRILGGYLSRLFPFLIGLLIFNYETKSYKSIFLVILLLISTDLLIFLTGERTALGLLIYGILLLMMMLGKYKKIRLITLIFSIFIMIFATLYDEEVRKRNIDHTLSQISGGAASTGRISTSDLILFSPQHHSLYTTSWRIFIDNPVLGTGPNTFRIICSNTKYAYDSRSCSTHPHNTYLQILSELGMLGLVFVLIIFIHLAAQIYKHFKLINKSAIQKTHDYEICLIITFLLTLFPFLPTQNFFNNWINIIYFLPIGFYLHSINSFTQE